MSNSFYSDDYTIDDIFDDFSQNTSQKTTSKKRKIPVIMISGFLGAGKTTLFNNILKSSKQLKIGAIINDFGSVNIDSKLVSGNVSEKTIELSNGCICCILGENGLKEPLDALANENSNLDAIIVEASGIAEPYDLMQTLRFSGNQYTYFGGNIYVVDCQNFNLANSQFPVHFKKCLQTSDIILLNKTNLVTPKDVNDIESFIRNINKRSIILKTDKAEIDTRLLFSNNTGNEHTEDEHNHHEHHSHDCSSHHHHHHHHHIHDSFQSVSFTTEKPLDPQAFINFLDNLPENMFRLKGFCYFGMKGYEQKYLIQIVGKTIDITSDNWNKNEELKTEIVLIGVDLDQDKINKQLKNIIDKSPEDIIPENMINFERFFL